MDTDSVDVSSVEIHLKYMLTPHRALYPLCYLAYGIERQVFGRSCVDVIEEPTVAGKSFHGVCVVIFCLLSNDRAQEKGRRSSQ